eukprot:COSAG01_NODE_6485_length_3638_cov_43.071207_6_plen_377_part_00
MSQKLIFAALKEAGASVKTRCLIRCIYNMARGRVRVMQQGSRALTDPFDIARGSLQGDKLACMLFELGQAMLLLHADPGRRLQQRCPNPVEPEWWCYSCMVTSTHATLHSLDRSATRPSWDSEWVTKDSKTCLTCRSIWERTGEYLIAEKSVEYVDDNLFMEIMDEKPQPSHARATVVEARVVEETGSQRPPVQPTGGVADRSAARSTAHNECDDRGSRSSSEYSGLSSDDEQNPDPTDPAVRTLNNRMKQVLDAGIEKGDIPVRLDKCGHLIVTDLPEIRKITEADVRIAYDKNRPHCRGCQRPDKNKIAQRSHERHCAWVQYIDNVQRRHTSSDSSDANDNLTSRKSGTNSHNFTVKQLVDMRGGGGFPRFYLV